MGSVNKSVGLLALSEAHLGEQSTGLNSIYKPLKDGEIRLLILLPSQHEDKVRCTLRHVLVDANPDFETISYAWGDPTNTTTVELEGRDFMVTHNLYLALKNLRHEDEERVIWADAICINQQDLEERSSQVKQMGDIYAKAKQVIVWLGEGSEVTRDAIDHFLKLHDFMLKNEDGYPDHPDRWRINPPGGSSVSIALSEGDKKWAPPIAALLNSPWFHRRWVIQEVAKSKTAVVVLGKRQIAWNIMANVVWSLHRAGFIAEISVDNMGTITQMGAQSVIFIELIRRDVLSVGGSNLLELIISVRMYQCLDPRDVIYSALGISHDIDTFTYQLPTATNTESSSSSLKPIRLQPDYSLSTEEVFHNFVLASIIGKRSLLPLSANYVPPVKPTLDLPSWVPDFANLNVANPLMFLRNEAALPFSASKGSTLQVHFSNQNKVMHIKGRIIDSVEGVSPERGECVLSPEQEEKSKAEDWTNDTIANVCTRIWLYQGIKLYDAKFDEPETTYGLTQDKFAMFSDVLLCGLTASGNAFTPDLVSAVAAYLDCICESFEVAATKYGKDGDREGFIMSILGIESSMTLRALGWCFAVTTGGRMGRVLSSAQKGDKIVLLGGGEVPYVLRERQEGGWIFRGACYIHGLMRGEGMKIDGIEDTEFAIY